MEAKRAFTEDLSAYLKKREIRGHVINYIKTDVTIGHSFDNGNYWELWMLGYLKRFYRANTNFVDVGAHIGSTSLLMSEVVSKNSESKIYAFEPVFHDIFFQNIRDNNLTDAISLYPCGIGSLEGSMTIPRVNYAAECMNFGGTSFVGDDAAAAYGAGAGAEEVPFYRLDSFQLSNVSVVKIDVENMEIEVLEGAMDLIAQSKPAILIETFDLDKLTRSAVFSQLSSMGYIIRSIPEGWNDYLMIVRPASSIPRNIYICDRERRHIETHSATWWNALNACDDYATVLYDDESIRSFLLTEYSQTHCDIFNFLEEGPIKADFWRVCVLYKYGGVYVDADVQPLTPICFFLEDDVDFLTCSSYGPQFNPHVIMARAGDETLRECVETYVDMYLRKTPYSYWGWSIMTLFNQALRLADYNKEDGVYYSGSRRVQIMKEIQADRFEDDHAVYKGLRAFNNRHSSYECSKHAFR